jgi:hypothetical protein
LRVFFTIPPHPHAHNGAVAGSQVDGLLPSVAGKDWVFCTGSNFTAADIDLEHFVDLARAHFEHRSEAPIWAPHAITDDDVAHADQAARGVHHRVLGQAEAAILVAQVRQDQLHVHRWRVDPAPKCAQAVEPVDRLCL